MDYDRGQVALGLLADRLAVAGVEYPHRFAFRPNTGMQTGFDVDGNGRVNDARDAQGYGLFSGQGGMAVLSRLPLDTANARDHSAFLWRDLPGSLSPDAPDLANVQRLATTGFWDVPALTPAGPLHLLAWHATPPVIREMKWLQSGGVNFNVGTMVDGLSTVMLVVVTLISLLVHVFSTDYVAGDRRYTHYFAFLSLFTASMLFSTCTATRSPGCTPRATSTLAKRPEASSTSP